MTYGVAAKKTPQVYVSDNGSNYIYNKTADQATAGLWSTGAGTPHPGKSFKPRHLTGRSIAGQKISLVIATAAGFASFALGGAVGVGGVTFVITGKHGEQSSG
jgi:hypothetical protein